MSRPLQLSAWVDCVSTHLPGLRGPQATVLALWSFGTAVIGRCGRTSVSCFLASLLGRQEHAVDQQLREWSCEAEAKTGSHRRTVEVQACFAPLLRWVLSLWPTADRHLAVALDATTLGQRFTVLVLCVLYDHTALPIAWVVLPAAQPGTWKTHWLALLRWVRDCIPNDWTVLVMADRGLYAPWLFRAVRRLGWHPFLRLNTGGTCRRLRQHAWQPLAHLLPQPGVAWKGEVVCFRQHPVRGTLVGRWECGYAEPWLILTDLDPDGAEAAWYAWRTWIECAFKTLKRGVWQWQATRMDDPERASRLWLVLALATLWTVTLGSSAEARPGVSPWATVPSALDTRAHAQRTRQSRKLSLVLRGRLVLLAKLIAQKLSTWFPLPLQFPQTRMGNLVL